MKQKMSHNCIQPFVLCSPSEFLLPDYLSHMQEEEEENLAHFEMTEQAFDVTATSSSSSSVQTPVISQVSSTMNYDSRPPASMAQNSPGSRVGHGSEEGTALEETKNAIAVTSLPELEKEEREKEGEGQNQKKALVSITIEWEAFHLIFGECVFQILWPESV